MILRHCSILEFFYYNLFVRDMLIPSHYKSYTSGIKSQKGLEAKCTSKVL